jgi:uncharacterized protein YcfL
MNFSGAKQSGGLILVATLLFGCASSSPKVVQSSPDSQMVVGSGTEDDRAAIDKSNQQFLNLEHQQSDSAVTSGQNQNLP